MKLYENQTFSSERALYGADGVRLVRCAFEGEEDGESALKESSHVELESCRMDLRYPLWHGTDLALRDVEMTPGCRAALWYAKSVRISDSRLHGIKAVRECEDVEMDRCDVVSPEFGWKSRKLSMDRVSLEGEYVFLEARDIAFSNGKLKGKYSFQYVENAVVEHCDLDTKDAFWHSRNVTVRDSTVRGEYLAWYSEGLTLERCRIIGTQPLCYARGLTLRDCAMEGCDLSFEYSDVEADVRGEILSVKNPRSGTIRAGSYGAVLFTDDAKMPCRAAVLTK